MRSTRNSVVCSKQVMTPRWHLIIVFLPLIDMDTSLARQIVIVLFNASRKRAIKLKMFFAVCHSNIGMATKCRLDRMPLTQMLMCMSKNELLRCVLPSPTIENAQIEMCNNKSVILFKLVATRVRTYWPMLWLLMPPNYYTLRWPLVWRIMAMVYRNDMPHLT